MPYGGEDIDIYWKQFKSVPAKSGKELLSAFCNSKSLVLLLKNAVIPMNKKGLLHLDIKSLNVLRKAPYFKL